MTLTQQRRRRGAGARLRCVRNEQRVLTRYRDGD
jgi:hypothetical protein